VAEDAVDVPRLQLPCVRYLVCNSIAVPVYVETWAEQDGTVLPAEPGGLTHTERNLTNLISETSLPAIASPDIAAARLTALLEKKPSRCTANSCAKSPTEADEIHREHAPREGDHVPRGVQALAAFQRDGSQRRVAAQLEAHYRNRCQAYTGPP
jgi:hypothetical protein